MDDAKTQKAETAIPPSTDRTDPAKREGRGLRVGLEVLPYIPTPEVLWRALAVLVWAAFAYNILFSAVGILVNYWFLEDKALNEVFWTNFTTQAILFAVGFVAFAVAVYVPLRAYAVSPLLRRAALHVSLWTGTIAGWILAIHYLDYLLAFNGVPFGTPDPVFGQDIGFYVFQLHALWDTRDALIFLVLAGMVSLLVARFDELSTAGVFRNPDLNMVGRLVLLAPRGFQALMGMLGLLFAAALYLSRYSLVFKDNTESGVRAGAEYIDVMGVLSNLNALYITAVMTILFTLTFGYLLYRIHQHYTAVAFPVSAAKKAPSALGGVLWKVLVVCGILIIDEIVIDLGFFVAVAVKDAVYVKPNEPYIQLDFIKNHMDGTVKAYGLDKVETVEWIPPNDPMPLDTLLTSKTVQNAPILPGWVSNLEEPIDPQHYLRFPKSKLDPGKAGSVMVYGPMLEIYKQQQQLRPYYRIVSVDNVRYTVDGEKRIYVSAVRELPSMGAIGPQVYLANWATSRFLYTHGMGLIMSPANQINEDGGPLYEIKDVPPQAENPLFGDVEPRIYFGESSVSSDLYRDYVLTNVRHLKEFDYASGEQRQEVTFPDDESSGIPIDSIFKRLVFALETRDFGLLFSEFIDHNRTRLHIFRSPIERIQQIAPFLFLDTNIYAFIAEGRTLWMINALTTSADYPYSYRGDMGDKSDERSIFMDVPERIVNYAEDSVKITIDAFTGAVHFYKISENPVINTYARIYPDLLLPETSMPAPVQAQLTYPLQWFHIQFDDMYKRYHQRNPIEFYNLEDLWDDADEVLGNMMGEGQEITFSYEPYNILLDPRDLPAGYTGVDANAGPQYAMLMPFTPEGAKNLRSLTIAFQDPPYYGKLVNLRIPQGTFITGPEQADAVIDSDSEIARLLSWWSERMGADVIRGHTLLLPVRGDLLYLEPIFVKSLQNEIPQVRLVSAVYHNHVTFGKTFEEALQRQAVPTPQP